MPDLTHIEPERRRAHATLSAKSPDELVNVKAGELVFLIDDFQRAREEALTFRGLLAEVYEQVGNHRPAERRHALTPGLRDRIRDTIFVTCPRCSGAGAGGRDAQPGAAVESPALRAADPEARKEQVMPDLVHIEPERRSFYQECQDIVSRKAPDCGWASHTVSLIDDLQREREQLESLWQNCTITFFPNAFDYPIEHNARLNKINRENIEVCLAARAAKGAE